MTESLEWVRLFRTVGSAAMDVEISPEQPDEVAAAIAAALSGPVPAPDPWWQAGLEESLET
jgi:hypothetical protein